MTIKKKSRTIVLKQQIIDQEADSSSEKAPEGPGYP